MAIATTPVGPDTGPVSRRTALVSELWRVTGSTGVATDTATITPRWAKKPTNVIGGPCTFSVNASTGVITITLKADIGNDFFDLEVLGNL